MSTTDLTSRELDVMAILWELGEASVADVQERLEDDLAYTSVLSALQLLAHKGHVSHRRVGRKYLYRASTTAEEAGGPMLDRLLESLYRRSPVRLVAHLVDRSGLTEDELREIRSLVDGRLEEDR